MAYGNETTRIVVGLKGRRQAPLLMVWREYLEDDEVVDAKVLFNSRNLRKEAFGFLSATVIFLLIYIGAHTL